MRLPVLEWWESFKVLKDKGQWRTKLASLGIPKASAENLNEWENSGLVLIALAIRSGTVAPILGLSVPDTKSSSATGSTAPKWASN